LVGGSAYGITSSFASQGGDLHIDSLVWVVQNSTCRGMNNSVCCLYSTSSQHSLLSRCSRQHLLPGGEEPSPKVPPSGVAFFLFLPSTPLTRVVDKAVEAVVEGAFGQELRQRHRVGHPEVLHQRRMARRGPELRQPPVAKLLESRKRQKNADETQRASAGNDFVLKAIPVGANHAVECNRRRRRRRNRYRPWDEHVVSH